MIFIRTDGNKDIATGHIQRCLSIADALRDISEAGPVFVTASREGADIIKERGYQCVLFENDYRDMESELLAFTKLGFKYSVMGYGPHLILVDSYQVTFKYFEGLRSIGKTAWIDDMGKEAYPVDVLINYDIHGPEVPYKDLYEKAGYSLPKYMLLGCGYAPLRGEFYNDNGASLNKEINPGNTSLDDLSTYPQVMISTGGGDKERILEKLPGYLKNIDAVFHMVIGPFVEEEEIKKLTEMSQNDPRYVLHQNVSSMSGLMKNCDAAIAAAGSTLYELCALGVPAIIFSFAENQRPMAECFGKKTGIYYAGDVVKEEDLALNNLRKGLLALMDDPQKMTELSKEMESISDGKGALRIAKVLKEYGDKHERTKGPA